MRTKEVLIACAIAFSARVLTFLSPLIFLENVDFSLGSIASVWRRWDAVCYYKIATFGYISSELSAHDIDFLSRFPPLFPVLSATFSFVSFLPVHIAGIIIAITSMTLAGGLLFTLCRYEGLTDFQSYLAVAFMSTFPTSYFTNAMYSEGLALLFLLLYFYFIRIKQCYGLASCVFLCLILTRTISIVLYPLHLFLLFRASTNPSLRSAKPWVFFTLPAIGLGLQLVIMTYFLDLPGYLGSSAPPPAIHLELRIPFAEMFADLWRIFDNVPRLLDEKYMMVYGWRGIFQFLSVCALPFIIRKLATPYHIYSSSLVLFLGFIPWNISAPRYVLLNFPLFLLCAYIKPKWIAYLLIFISFGANIYFASVFTSGRSWAF